jgi:type II secretory pathway pseudopilin PulG
MGVLAADGVGVLRITTHLRKGDDVLDRIRAGLDPNAEQGVTVIEMLVLIIIVGALLAVAVPAYLGFRDRTASSTAKANLRAALPAATAYREDHRTFKGMQSTDLLAIDPGVSTTLVVAAAKRSSFCLTDTVSGRTWSVAGPHPTSSDYRESDDCS